MIVHHVSLLVLLLAVVVQVVLVLVLLPLQLLLPLPIHISSAAAAQQLSCSVYYKAAVSTYSFIFIINVEPGITVFRSTHCSSLLWLVL
jgi:hypothetical protein